MGKESERSLAEWQMGYWEENFIEESPERHDLKQVIKVNITSNGTNWHPSPPDGTLWEEQVSLLRYSGRRCITCVQFSSVQSLSRVRLFETPWIAARQASLSITNSRSLLKLISIEPVMTSNHLILCCPLLLSLSIFPNIRVFSNESALLIRWPRYWSFRFSISPSNEHPELISFRMDCLYLLAGQGTLKSLFQQFKSINSLALSFHCNREINALNSSSIHLF